MPEVYEAVGKFAKGAWLALAAPRLLPRSG